MWIRTGLLGSILVLPAILISAERRRAKDVPEVAAATETVEMFRAMDSKDIEVKVIPKDEKELRVFFRNNTNKPLNVRLPDVCASVQILHQALGGVGARPGGAPGGANQATGGGFGGAGGGGLGGGGGAGGGGGLFNIAAERVVKFNVATVCLEHGKKEPRAGIPYEIRPIESVTSNPEVIELLSEFGNKRLSQRATQAAAWHMANGLSWDQLANKSNDHL